jgi:hypothetical protein
METAQDARPEPVAETQVAVEAPAPETASIPGKLSILAVASGYAGLIPFVTAFFVFPYAYAGYPPNFHAKGIAISATISVACVIPALVLAILGHRRLRRNRTLRGIGHVRFAYVSCAMALGVLLTALALIPLRH